MKTILKEDILGLLDLVKGKDMYLINENGETVYHKREIKEWVCSLKAKYGFITNDILFNSIVIDREGKGPLIIHFDPLPSVTRNIFFNIFGMGIEVYEISPRTFLVRDKIVRAETAYEAINKVYSERNFNETPMVSVLEEVY